MTAPNCPACGKGDSAIAGRGVASCGDRFCSGCGFSCKPKTWIKLAEQAAKTRAWDRFLSEREGSCRVSADREDVDAWLAEERRRGGL